VVDSFRLGRLAFVRFGDLDTDDCDPFVVKFDIDKGNPQIAHGIGRILRPLDLP
jgi:hypothetical protein